MTCTHYNFPVPEEKMVRVITDTDLCNEADDPFAVVQALLSPKFDNVGVVAAHFGTRDPNGMQKSWQGLKDLTVLMQLTVPVQDFQDLWESLASRQWEYSLQTNS